MNKKLAFLAACLQFANIQAEDKSVLQGSALSKYDFSFLPESVAEFDGAALSSSKLLELLDYQLAKLPSTFLSADELKQLTLSFIEKYYERQVSLALAYEAGIQPNEGVAELELQMLEKEMGKGTLIQQFEVTGRKFSDRVAYLAETKAIQSYFQDEILTKQKVNEAEALEYYYDNEAQFILDENIKIAQIYSGFVKLNQKEAALKKIKKAMSRLTFGEDFSVVAADFSFGENDKSKGVIDQYFTRESLRPALKSCFDLQVGQVSGILESSHGYHIVKVLERKPAGKQDFDDIKKALMNKLTLNYAQKELHKRIVNRMKKGDFKLYIKP